MPKFDATRRCPPGPRARSAAGAMVAVALALLILMPVRGVGAGAPRCCGAAWLNAFNAKRGNPSSETASGSATSTNIAPNSPASGGNNIAQSIADFTRAARAIAQAQAAQAQAAQAAGSAATAPVPNGLTPGGLWVDPSAVAANPGLWSGAALPTAGPSATGAGATGRPGGTTVTVNQTTTTAVLNWNSFNIGAKTTLQFNQGGSNWTVLNKVGANATPSTILGAISAPGLVLVLNPNGILFGAGSQVNVGSLLVAATASFAASQFTGSQFNGVLSTTTGSGTGTVYNPVFGCPSFTCPGAAVTVDAGASITTNPPAAASDRGGYVLLLGQSVQNNGRITTANGQTVLGAGQDFIIRDGYGSTGPNSQTSTTLGLEVAPIGPGNVTNTGLIQATTGDITLTGETVLQAGVLLSTTTVAQRGSIHLLTDVTDAASSITFASGSLTAIQPQDDGTTATDAARETLIEQSATDNALRSTASLLPNQVGSLPDQQYQSRIEIVSGGTVEFQDSSLNLSTGGQIAVYAAGRVLTDTGATLSVAGSVDTTLPATANTLTFTAEGYDLRDAPANRETGNLNNQTVNVGVGQLVQIANPNDPASPYEYTSGGLLEVSGYLNGVGHSIGEWTSVGGAITLSAAQVVAQQGATFNIAGGLVTYAAGNTPNTWLKASNGQIYNINTAPANATYVSVYNGFTVSQPRWGITDTFISPLIGPATTYNAAYTVGRDAGTLTINAPTTVMEAMINAGINTGEFQNGARPAIADVAPAYYPFCPAATTCSTIASDSYFDPFLLAQTVVPLPGTLVIGPVALPGAVPTISSTDVAITQNGQPLASSLGVTTPIPTNRVDTTWLAASVLNDAALGGLTVVTQGAIQFDAPVSLADGAAVSMLAPTVTLASTVTARGGQVTIGNYSPTYFTASANFLDLTDATGAVLPSSVTFATGAMIDTRGIFTNVSIDPTTSAGEAFVNGGPVTIDTSGAVSLAAGSTIDASAGGAVLMNRSALGGTGGAISITAYDPNDRNAAAPSAPVTIAATLRSFGSGAVMCTACVGGALTLNVPSVLITSDGTADPSGVTLTPDFFTSGFSSYTITGQNGLTVADGTQIAVVQPIEQFTAATVSTPSGADPSAAFTVLLPALYTPNTATATMIQRPGASITLRAGTPDFATGGITIGAGSTISVDPSQTIGLEALGKTAIAGAQAQITPGQITINGTLTAPAGTISVVNDQEDSATSAPDNLSIWLGATSVLDVSARAATALDSTGQVFGTVPNGGTIRIGGPGGVDTNGDPISTSAFVVVEPGAVLSAAGASAVLDPAAGQDLSGGTIGHGAAGQLIQVAGNGGTISFDSENGIYLGGRITAPAGGAGAQGGTFSVNLVTPDYTNPSTFSSGAIPDVPAYQVPRELVIGTSPGASPGVTQPGKALPDTAFGQARVSTSQIAAGGFDVVDLASGDAILFDGSAALSAGRAITLATAILGDTGAAGAASVTAPYITLAGTGTPTHSGLTFQRSEGDTVGGTSPEWLPPGPGQATLAVNATNIDVSGSLYVGVSAPIISVPAGASAPCPVASCAVANLAGFASMILTSSGDIRFLPSTTSSTTTLTTPGDLTLIAGQVYPVTGANAIVTAGFAYDAASQASNYDGTLTIAAAPGPVPAPPLTAGGQITLRAGVIDQGGVLRAPDGQITLGAFGNSSTAPTLAADAATTQVVLQPGSITSVSMNGLTIPYGGTSDGTTYTLDGVTVSAVQQAGVSTTSLPPPQLSLEAQTIQVQARATINLSGGGVLAGAGFVPGEGGSTNILQAPLLTLTAAGKVTQPSASTNLVFAIVPGFGGVVAPPPATAAPFTGPLPATGEQITLGAGVPGLPAGTYTLLPGSDALLPGAYRVELATTAHAVLPGVINLGNGSYVLDGYRGVANTNILAALPVSVTVTPGAAVRQDAQYDETNYADFERSQIALFGQARASLALPADTKTLTFSFPTAAPVAGLALQLDGTVLSTPAPGGLGGIVQVTSQAPIEVIASHGAPTAGMVSILGSDLNSLDADTLIVGGSASSNPSVGQQEFISSTPSVTVRNGATLAAAQVFLVATATGDVTVEAGASIDTIGRGATSRDSSTGLIFSNAENGIPVATVLAISNGTISFLPSTGGGAIDIGTCPSTCASPASLLSAGTIATLTGGAVTLDSSTRLGTAALDLSASVINFGTPPAGTSGLTLTSAGLQALLTGDQADGVPGLRQLTLTANQSANFYGSVDLNAGSLQSFELNSPAIYGAPGVVANVTTGTFIWNGVLAAGGTTSAPPGAWLGGGGSAPSALTITANTIVFGYGPSDQAQDQVSLDRLILGFDSVTLTASQNIEGSNRGTLSVYRTPSVGGDLTLTTPMLTGGPGSVFTITTGGNLAINAPANQPATAIPVGQGASLTLNAANISDNTAIVLPSGQLTMNAQGSIALADGSVLNLAGVTTTLSDQSTDGWGGTVTLQAATGGISQTSGGTIDVSAGNANAGSVTVSAPGVVNLAGTINGGAAPGYTSGSFTVRAGGLGASDPTSGFAALNATLDAGGFFGGRSFELLAGDLAIGAGTTVTANTVSVSVDAGTLTVAGTVNASGMVPGSIELSSGGDLTLAAGAVLDAHATVAQVDSNGQSIDAENQASVTLTSASGTLIFAPASQGFAAPLINVSAAPGVTCAIGACGQITLNAPRTGKTDGGVKISAGGPVTIDGAGSIVVNAFWTYAPTDANGTIVQDNGGTTAVATAGADAGFVGLNQINTASQTFMTAADANATLQAALAGLTSYGSAFHLRPGVEIDSSTASGGNLTVASDLDLSGYRYTDPQTYGLQVNAAITGSGEPGALVIRAADNLTITGNITDGFTGAPTLATDASGSTTYTYWELAQPIQQTAGAPLPLSWSLRLVAGADLNAADSRVVLPSDQLTPTATDPTPGSITLNDPHPQPYNPLVPSASSFQLPGWSVIRTGTGDLDLLAGGSIDELSTYAIYTAGAPVPANAAFDVPRGTIPSPLKVTLTGPRGTKVAAGSEVTYTNPNGTTTTFVTTSTVNILFGSATVTVQAPSGAVFDISSGTHSTVRSSAGVPITGVTATADGVLTSSGTALGTNGAAVNNGTTLDSLISNYQAWYPVGGGNVLISAGGNITGYLATPPGNSAEGVQPMDGVGNWLWRQGGTGSGLSTAWWINYGTLALPLNNAGENSQSTEQVVPVPTLTGFTGIGTLGGGNVTILAGGNIGAVNANTSPAAYSVTQALDVAIASTGQVSAGATSGSGIVETGGGVLTIRAGGALNAGGTTNNVGDNQQDGTLTDLRGSINIQVAAVGEIPLAYGGVNDSATTGVGDPLATNPLVAYEAAAWGGPILVPGDATVSLQARGDLVLGGVGDPTRLAEQNVTPVGTSASAAGLTWFSLWQPGTAIQLDSAGGNLVISTQAEATNVQQENAPATDNRYIYPPTLIAIAGSGSIYAGSNVGGAAGSAAEPTSIELAPSPTGQLELLTGQSIYGDSVSGGQPQSIDVSGAATAGLPTPLNAAFQTVSGTTSNLAANIGAQPLSLFAFEADTASGTLHAGDLAPALIYAGGDIIDVGYGETLCFEGQACPGTSSVTPSTWYLSGKAVRIIAGGNIVEAGSLLGQQTDFLTGNYYSSSGLIVNNNTSDVSVIQAGGEILYANATVAGPGELYVQAGGNVYQADKGVLQSLGPLSNGTLSAGSSRTGGASVTVLAGVGATGPDWQAFARTYLAPSMGYGTDLLDYLRTTFGYTGDTADAPAFFEALPIAEQRAFLLRIYFDELNASGLEFTNPSSTRYKSYARGKAAIASLFPAGSTGTGDITLFPTALTQTIGNSGIRTDFGGNVTLLTPGGSVALGNTTQPCQAGAVCSANPAGVLTQGTGDVDIFSQGSVILGQSRVFTTFGGNIVIWSAAGDINAGRGAQTTQLVSPTEIQYDSFGRVTLTPGIPTSGAGIATLAPIPGTPPGDVDLVAPLGIIDAGEAGIRVSGNANLAALSVVNAANVQVGGKSSGLPTVAVPNVAALSAASAAAAATAQSGQQASAAAGARDTQNTPSIITVELVGYGDAACPAGQISQPGGGCRSAGGAQP